MTLNKTADRIIGGTRTAIFGRVTAAATAAAAVMIGCAGAALAATPSGAAATRNAAPVAGVALNYAASPHTFGYPDATNTGVSPSVPLRSVPSQVSSGPGWKYDSRGWVEVYGNGATLSNLYIPMNLDISGSNVTINNVWVVKTGNSFGISLRHANNVTIQNSSISSPYNSGPNRLQVAIKDVYNDSTGTTIVGNNIWNTDTGIQLAQGTVKNNYVHDLVSYGDDHVNGIKSEGGNTSRLQITHNTVFNPISQTDAIGIFENDGPQQNTLISDNLVAGAGYTIYGGANPGKWTPSSITITNNRFARIYFPAGGYFGPATALALGVNGNTWTGNIWDDTGKPVTP